MIEGEGTVGRRSGALWGLLFMAATLAVGCGGDDMTEPNDTQPSTLNLDEARWLFSTMRGVQTDGSLRILHASDDSLVAACPAGGQVRVTGALVEEQVADTLRFGWDYAVAPTGCQFVGEGENLTVDGDPGVRDRFVLTMIGTFEAILIGGSVAGALEWRLGDRFGSCAIDMTVSGAVEPSDTGPAIEAILSGMLCGHDTEVDIDAPSVPSG